MPGQLSFLTAGIRPPAVDDLEGLLFGVAQWSGSAARRGCPCWSRTAGGWTSCSAAYGERGLRGEVLEEDGLTSVRTPFSRSLLPVAERWVRGAVKSVPPGMTLDGARLRLWAVGAGRRDEHGYLLRLSPHDPPVWEAAGAALAAVGVAGAFVGVRARRSGVPGYRPAAARSAWASTSASGRPRQPREDWPT